MNLEDLASPLMANSEVLLRAIRLKAEADRLNAEINAMLWNEKLEFYQNGLNRPFSVVPQNPAWFHWRP